MEGRCAVDTVAEFGTLGASCTPTLQFGGGGTDVFLCSGGDEVYVFCTKERRVTAVLRLPGPVSDLAGSQNKLLYVACRGGVYCVALQCLLSRAPSSSADAPSSPAELLISSEFLAAPEEGVLSLLLVGSVLLTLSTRDASCVLTLYNTPKQLASSSCEMLGSFSLVSGVARNENEVKTAKTRRPVLICIHSSDTTPPSSSFTPSSEITGGHFHLEAVLFKLLFGIDAALARSPVVLCGLPDGRLCFLPLRPPGSRLRVLHSLEQPVVFVGVTETRPGQGQCLVAVGELGTVLLITKDKGGPEGGGITTSFIERCVPGPVMCGCMDKNCLYYSTGSDLLRLDLSEGSSEETSRKTVLQSPGSLNVCRVTALAEPTYNSAGEVQLLGLSVGGQLQRITLPACREDAGLSKVPSTQVGRGIKELLSAIGDVYERASALKNAIKSKNQTLQHMNHLLNVSFLLMASTNSEECHTMQEKPIRCHAMTKWSRLLQKDSLDLTCVLNNSSPYALERGWTLSITVFPLSLSPCSGGESSSTNFSFPFHNLHPGEAFEVSLPLAAAGDASFPVTVSCSLIFSLSSVLGEEAGNLPGLQSSCFSLPLNTLTVDWLHALQVNSPTASHKKATAQCSSSATDAIQVFLSSRQIKCRGRGESASKSEHNKYSASVRVSSELLRDTLVLKSSGSDPQRPKLAPQNLCLSLLDWLFADVPGGVKTGHQGEKVSSSMIHARGPDGHSVKLSAKEVSVGEGRTEKEESLTAVEVWVESPSIAAVCGLHHAVLRRVQTLLQRAPEKTASTQMIQSLGLRQALQRAQHLLQQIQQSRVSGAFGVGASTGQLTSTLLHVYRELRENPLLII